LTEDGEPVWKTDVEELELKRQGVNFVRHVHEKTCVVLN
jgi:hypothetical protein